MYVYIHVQKEGGGKEKEEKRDGTKLIVKSVRKQICYNKNQFIFPFPGKS